LNKRAEIPPSLIEYIKKLPKEMNTTAQLSNCLLQLQTKSVFAKGYREGMNKSLYWDATYEDSLDLIAKIPRLAAYIYRNKFHVIFRNIKK
jgi:citrate synthase